MVERMNKTKLRQNHCIVSSLIKNFHILKHGFELLYLKKKKKVGKTWLNEWTCQFFLCMPTKSNRGISQNSAGQLFANGNILLLLLRGANRVSVRGIFNISAVSSGAEQTMFYFVLFCFFCRRLISLSSETFDI